MLLSGCPFAYLMSLTELVDQEVMTHLSLYGCCKNMDPFALHMLKTSQHPILRFRRDWMRRTALKQHLDAEKRQEKINGTFKGVPLSTGCKTMRQEAIIDNVLADEMRHYNGAPITEKAHLRAIRAEAPAIFPKRE